MSEARKTGTPWRIQPTGVKLGVLYALFPLSFGVGELVRRRPGADAAMTWMAVAAGIVFASVTLAYSQGFTAGQTAGTAPDVEKTA